MSAPNAFHNLKTCRSGFASEVFMSRVCSSRVFAIVFIGFIGLLYWPATASAQSSIAGQVRDNTGGVVPGATVEAASPALIEGRRAVVTDGQGRYSIVDLRPGTYSVTF